MVTAVALGVAVVGLGLQVAAGKKADKAAKAQVETQKAASAEKVRRIDKAKGSYPGTQAAAAGGGGVDLDSRSLLEVRDDSLNEFEYDVAITERAGIDAISTVRLQGDAARVQAIGGVASSVGQIASIGADAGWWGNSSAAPTTTTAPTPTAAAGG